MFPFLYLSHSFSSPIFHCNFVKLPTLSPVPVLPIHGTAVGSDPMEILFAKRRASTLLTVCRKAGFEVEAQRLEIAHYLYEEIYLRIS